MKLSKLLVLSASVVVFYIFLLSIPHPSFQKQSAQVFNSFGTTYYVATTGDDGNPGTLSAPFATMSKAAKLLNPGDTVYIRGGTYNRQSAIFSRSGTATAPITVAGYPDETVIIDGQNSFPTGLYDPLIQISGDYINLQNLTIQNSYGMGLIISGNNNYIKHIKAYQNGENGILITAGSYNTVEDSEAYYNAKQHEFAKTTPDGYWASGLSVARGGASHNTLRRNKIWNNWGEGLSTFAATYNTFEDNISWDNWTISAYLQNTNHTLFQRNLVYQTPNNLMVQYGGSAGTLELGDECPDQAVLSSDNTIINNLIWGGDRGLYFWRGVCGGGLVNDLIANNTIVNAWKVAGMQIEASPEHSNTVFANNIIVEDNPSLPIAYLPTTSAGLTFFNNIWSKALPSAYQTVGLANGGIVTNPQLTKTGSTAPGQLTSDYFKLTYSSPAIGKAVALPQISEDYFKTTRDSSPDIGAYEYKNPILPPPPSDTIAPSVPTNLYAIAISNSQINISWSASTDNIGVTGYDVFRNDTLCTSTIDTSFSNTGLAANTTYVYTVRAKDIAGNNSLQSAPTSATTLGITPINGQCGPTINSCTSGTLSDLADSQTQNIWECLGSNGGTSASCSKNIPSVPSFYIGQRIKTTAKLNVRPTPTTSSKTLGSQPINALGVILSGPTQATGYTWWNINYDNAPDGYSIQDYLTAFTPKFNVGDLVYTTSAIKVRPSAGSKSSSCTQPVGSYATIAAGPQSVGGFLWWQVNFVSSCSGWGVEDYLSR